MLEIETVVIGFQKCCRTENFYVGDGQSVKVAKVMEVARDEVIHAGENSGCEDGLVLESQVYAGRNNLHWAVADHACS